MADTLAPLLADGIWLMNKAMLISFCFSEHNSTLGSDVEIESVIGSVDEPTEESNSKEKSITPRSSPTCPAASSSNIRKFRGKRRSRAEDLKDVVDSFAKAEEASQQRFMEVILVLLNITSEGH